jgi:hypothetical protein
MPRSSLGIETGHQWNGVLLEKLPKKFLAFYGTLVFITAFTRAHN